ncbi:zinc-finger-containing protein [Bacillus bombysepticus]|uniref:zinc-finger-containing protein n=1 Tax=Bacillus bombysepticus TaxID=658666 RepID=UPI00301B54E2
MTKITFNKKPIQVNKIIFNKRPTQCPHCNGKVVYTSNKEIYGKEYGNGRCYLCRGCKAYTGVHTGTDIALGILATKEMTTLRKKCHKLFDPVWKVKKVLYRNVAYKRLAYALNIKRQDCHFGHFDTEMLHKAIRILSNPNWYR